MKKWPRWVMPLVIGVIIGWAWHDIAGRKESGFSGEYPVEVWVNTKRNPAGTIHRSGCRYYGIGHGYYTRRPPNEAVECKLCGDGESLESRLTITK